MSQPLNAVLLLTGLIAVLAGAAALHENAGSFTLVVFGIGLVAAAWVGEQRRNGHLKAQRRADTDRRIAELMRPPWAADQTLKVRGNSLTPVALLLSGLLSTWMVYAGVSAAQRQWPLIIAGGLWLTLTAIAASRCIAGFGKSVCELDRDGLCTPIHGHIPWSEVSGLHFQQDTRRGVTTSTLLLRVERYREVVTGIHWTERLLAAFGAGALARGIVSVPLKNGDEEPETLEAVARLLWKRATGHDYPWNPGWSNDFNDAAKRIGSLRALRQSNDEIRQHITEHPHEALAEYQQLSRDMATISQELARHTGKLK